MIAHKPRLPYYLPMMDAPHKRERDTRRSLACMPLGALGVDSAAQLLAHYGLTLVEVADGVDIPGSYWGPPEAGLVGHRLFARLDTPVHSVLHEASHFICMDPKRRAQLRADAGGDDAEESAVCYLQILLAGQLRNMGMERMQQDMDAWGYSFRLGTTARWFREDAADARDWLVDKQILHRKSGLTGRTRSAR